MFSGFIEDVDVVKTIVGSILNFSYNEINVFLTNRDINIIRFWVFSIFNVNICIKFEKGLFTYNISRMITNLQNFGTPCSSILLKNLRN